MRWPTAGAGAWLAGPGRRWPPAAAAGRGREKVVAWAVALSGGGGAVHRRCGGGAGRRRLKKEEAVGLGDENARKKVRLGEWIRGKEEKK